MAFYTAYATYVVWFADAAEYAFAVATAGGTNFIETCPDNAAALFGITVLPGQPGTDLRGIYHIVPPITSNIGHPLPSGISLLTSQDSVLVPGQPGNPPSIWPAGPDLLLKWSGFITRVGGGNPAEPELETPIPQRRWIGGDFTPNAEYMGGAPTSNTARIGSRTVGGFGYVIRGANTGNVMNVNIDTVVPGLQPSISWDRFYFRVRVFPTSARTGIWRCGGFPSLGAGASIAIMPGGVLEVYNVDAVGTLELKGSVSGLEVNRWYRGDVILQYRTGGLGGNLRLWIDGSAAVSYVQTDGVGLNQNTRHVQSDFGRWTSVHDVDVEIDMDDFHDSDRPEFMGAESLESIDWFMGSHQRRHHVVSATMTNWVPPNIHVFQAVNPFTNVQALSSTNGAVMKALTDAIEEMDSPALTFGVVAMLINSMSTNATTDGQIGYDIGGGDVLATINQTGAAAWATGLPVMYRPSGMVFPDPIVPLSIVKRKSLDVNADQTFGVALQASYIGTWGEEDDPLAPNLLLLDYLHNCRYDNTPWAYLLPSTDSPCYAVGGTYTGNSTFNEIPLPAPAHMIWIRATSGAATSGVMWLAAGIAANFGTTDRMYDSLSTYMDLDGNAFFRVAGNGSEINLNAVVYQYIAFCDPGMRFSTSSAFCKSVTLPGFLSIPFTDPNFGAECMFVQQHQFAAISGAQGLSFKGPGSGANDGRFMTGAAITNWGQLGVGGFGAGVDIRVNSQSQTTYMAFRTSEPNCAGIMIQTFTYTGNGAGGTRVIPVTPAGGRFPLFVIVQPQAAAAAHFRDPSHIGSNSSNMTNLSNSVTAIVAGGIDTISVGVTLNVNLVVYTVFMIPGDSAAWNNGAFFNPNCEGFPGPGPTPPLPAVLGDGGLILNGTTPLTILRDISGIYTLVPGKTNDTMLDRQVGQPEIDVKINPIFKTGYIGG